MSSSPEIELPECPVCLQSYNHHDTIPRVLPCGHSTCQSCLAHIPLSLSSSLSHAIRCPSCTQLVKLPHPQGPSALPKNIDLLRFVPSNSQPNHKKNNVEFPLRRRFPHEIWSDELYLVWKKWVIPERVVLVEEDGIGKIVIGSDSVGFDMGLCPNLGCCLIDGQKVGLVRIGCFKGEEVLVEYGYVGKVMSVLGNLSDATRAELGTLLGVSLRNSRVCRVLGLWFDVESGYLFLVSDRHDGLLSVSDLQCGFVQGDDDWIHWFSSIGVELCEAMIGLHSEGFIFGCLGLSCLQFDKFGHVCIDLGEALVAGRKILKKISNFWVEMGGSQAEELVMNMANMDVFVSPEVLFELQQREGIKIENNETDCTINYSSDVWLLACVLIMLFTGDQFSSEMYHYLKPFFERKSDALSESKIMYLQWLEMIKSTMLETLTNSCPSLHDILLKCLVFDPGNRPLAIDVWKCLKGNNERFSVAYMKENVGPSLLLGELCSMSKYSRHESKISELNEECSHCVDPCQSGEDMVDNVVQEICTGKVQCKDLQGHLDCITGLCVGGGFLFSCSFDKTVNVWSLQDFTHVHTFRGHEHRVMAVIYVDQEKPLCISADSGGGIFAWEVMLPFRQEPLKKWYEDKDWRYSGIHALAISESSCLYTGSGDRLIKVWSLEDHTLLCSMEGHKSVISTLSLSNGVLYSGSWDGTVRLWCLHDHSPLAVFGEDVPGTVSSVLSLQADQNLVIAAYENGNIKIWMNDVLKESRKVHDGAILTLGKEEKWMFTGGWDKTLKFQEVMMGNEFEMEVREVGSIACGSVITTLLYVGGILFVGFANKLIKVYYCGS